MVTTAYLEHLKCPKCGGGLRLGRSCPNSNGLRGPTGLVGCLECRAEYPTVFGVLILRGPTERVDVYDETTDASRASGPTIAEVTARLRDDDVAGAMALLIPMPPGCSLLPDGMWPRPSGRGGDFVVSAHGKTGLRSRGVRFGWRVLNRVMSRVARRAMESAARRRLARFLMEHGGRCSGMEVIDLFYRRVWNDEMATYFGYRFGQPRHLAGLAVARAVAAGSGPILDLACGAGHLTHYFTTAHPGRPVYGIDRDFFRLFLARQFIAPAAQYVCMDVSGRWPFADHSLSAVFCSDAFHYFPKPESVVAEARRVSAQDGSIAFTRFGNLSVGPNEGFERDVEGYRRLFAPLNGHLMGEDELVSRYFRHELLTTPSVMGDTDLGQQKWLTLLRLSPESGAVAGGQPGDWPHAMGVVEINPLYSVVAEQPAHLDLELRFPSPWFEFENAKCLEYAPKSCRLPRAVLTDARAGRLGPSVQPFLRNLVLVGLPEAYRSRHHQEGVAS